MIEAALLLPVLIFLGFGAFELSYLFFKHQAVTAGIRDAARYAARTPRPAGMTCEEALDRAELVTAAKNLAVSGDIFASTPARISGWGVSNVTVTATAIDNPIDPDSGTRVYRGPDQICVVQVSSTFSPGFFAKFNMIPSTISVSHAERWIGG